MFQLQWQTLASEAKVKEKAETKMKHIAVVLLTNKDNWFHGSSNVEG